MRSIPSRTGRSRAEGCQAGAALQPPRRGSGDRAPQQAPWRRRPRLRAVQLRVHQHLGPGRRARGLRALRRSGDGPHLLRGRPGELHPARADRGRLRARGSRTAAHHRGRAPPHRPAGRRQGQLPQVPAFGRDHRVRRVPREVASARGRRALGRGRAVHRRLARPRASPSTCRHRPRRRVIMDLGLADKVAVLTGASKGIGLAVTKTLVGEAPAFHDARGGGNACRAAGLRAHRQRHRRQLRHRRRPDQDHLASRRSVKRA
jgi:hypothetical protein